MKKIEIEIEIEEEKHVMKMKREQIEALNREEINALCGFFTMEGLKGSPNAAVNLKIKNYEKEIFGEKE